MPGRKVPSQHQERYSLQLPELPARKRRLEGTFGRCASFLWHDIATKSRDRAAEAKHVNQGKRVLVFCSRLASACFAKEALRGFTLASDVVPQWLAWLPPDTVGV